MVAFCSFAKYGKMFLAESSVQRRWKKVSRVERGVSQIPKGSKEVKILGDGKLHLTPWFKDHAELSRASYSYVEYARVALVQAIRRNPRLQEKIENLARRFGKEIDLSQRLA